MDILEQKILVDKEQDFSDLIEKYPQFEFEACLGPDAKLAYLHKSKKFGLGLMSPGSPDLFLPIDFLAADLQRRKRFFSPKKEALVKAIGKIPEGGYVLDGTAGLGRESYLLASTNYQVVGVEQSPYLYILLNEAVHNLYGQLNLSLEKQRLNFLWGDFQEQATLLEHKPEVIYLDPMFPSASKSAKVKKPMQVLQRMELKSLSVEEYLKKAKLVGAKKLVFKRPKEAPVLAPEELKEYYENETIRFEIY